LCTIDTILLIIYIISDAKSACTGNKFILIIYVSNRVGRYSSMYSVFQGTVLRATEFSLTTVIPLYRKKEFLTSGRVYS